MSYLRFPSYCRVGFAHWPSWYLTFIICHKLSPYSLIISSLLLITLSSSIFIGKSWRNKFGTQLAQILLPRNLLLISLGSHSNFVISMIGWNSFLWLLNLVNLIRSWAIWVLMPLQLTYWSRRDCDLIVFITLNGSCFWIYIFISS